MGKSAFSPRFSNPVLSSSACFSPVHTGLIIDSALTRDLGRRLIDAVPICFHYSLASRIVAEGRQPIHPGSTFRSAISPHQYRQKNGQTPISALTVWQSWLSVPSIWNRATPHQRDKIAPVPIPNQPQCGQASTAHKAFGLPSPLSSSAGCIMQFSGRGL